LFRWKVRKIIKKLRNYEHNDHRQCVHRLLTTYVAIVDDDDDDDDKCPLVVASPNATLLAPITGKLYKSSA